VVAGSNPVAPTIFSHEKGDRRRDGPLRVSPVREQNLYFKSTIFFVCVKPGVTRR
jgi:hypothetical protein